MEKSIKHYFIKIVAFFLILGFTSCSDWTEQENIKLNEPSNEDKVAYEKYLENIRKYKTKDHPIVYGWFDNSEKTYTSSGHHLKYVPDSVDILSLMYADNLTDKEIAEMSYIQEKKGIKVIFTIDSEAIVNKLEKEAKEQETPENEEVFLQKLSAALDYEISLLGKYKYDGLSLYYAGKAGHYQPSELDIQRQVLIFEKFEKAINDHPQKIFLFEGSPENVENKQIFNKCKYVVLRTLSATNLAEIVFYYTTLPEDVPHDKLIFSTMSYSITGDEKAGVFFDSEGKKLNAIIEIAKWNPSIKKAGVGIYRINDDYYNAAKDYLYTRTAINIMNPSPNYQ